MVAGLPGRAGPPAGTPARPPAAATSARLARNGESPAAARTPEDPLACTLSCLRPFSTVTGGLNPRTIFISSQVIILEPTIAANLYDNLYGKMLKWTELEGVTAYGGPSELNKSRIFCFSVSPYIRGIPQMQIRWAKQ